MAYESTDYWDERYRKQSNTFHDWYFNWNEFFEHNGKELGLCAPILMVGCGNSDVSMKMEAKGMTPVVSMDISKVVCRFMTDMTKGCYVPMDVCNLQFRDEVFDCVLDKGTLDAIMCDTAGGTAVTNMMKEICRVMTVGGIFILITLAPNTQFLHCLNSSPHILPWRKEHSYTVDVKPVPIAVHVYKKYDKFVAKDSHEVLKLERYIP